MIFRRAWWERCTYRYKHDQSLPLLPVEALQRAIGRVDAAILGFFEDREAAQVGVGKEEIAGRFREPPALVRREEAGDRARHGVPQAQDIDAGNALANVGMGALQIVEDGFFPEIPVFIEQQLAVGGGRTFGQRPVERPDGAIDVSSERLVRRDYVTQRGRIVDDIVPGGFESCSLGRRSSVRLAVSQGE